METYPGCTILRRLKGFIYSNVNSGIGTELKLKGSGLKIIEPETGKI